MNEDIIKKSKFWHHCMNYYNQIFKRKSFHLFRDTGMITDQDIRKLEEFIGSVKPLYAEIKTEVTWIE